MKDAGFAQVEASSCSDFRTLIVTSNRRRYLAEAVYHAVRDQGDVVGPRLARVPGRGMRSSCSIASSAIR